MAEDKGEFRAGALKTLATIERYAIELSKTPEGRDFLQKSSDKCNKKPGITSSSSSIAKETIKKLLGELNKTGIITAAEQANLLNDASAAITTLYSEEKRSFLSTKPSSTLESVKAIFDHALEAQRNQEKVQHFLVSSAKAVPTDEGRNLTPGTMLEMMDPLHRPELDLLDNSKINGFVLLNEVAIELKANNEPVSKENIIKRIEALAEDPNDQLADRIREMGHKVCGNETLKPMIDPYLSMVSTDHKGRTHIKTFDRNKQKVDYVAMALTLETNIAIDDLQYGYVKYLDPKEREKYLVKEENGQLYTEEKVKEKDGTIKIVKKIVDTTQAQSPDKEPGTHAFVLDRTGNLYIGEHIENQFYHSSFLSGEQAQASGMICVKNGKVTYIDNVSGHYQPNEIEMVRTLKAIPQSCLLEPNPKNFNAQQATVVVNYFTPDNRCQQLQDITEKDARSFEKSFWIAVPNPEGKVKLFPAEVTPNNQKGLTMEENRARITAIIPACDLVTEVENIEKTQLEKKQAQWQAHDKEFEPRKQDPKKIRQEHRNVSISGMTPEEGRALLSSGMTPEESRALLQQEKKELNSTKRPPPNPPSTSKNSTRDR